MSDAARLMAAVDVQLAAMPEPRGIWRRPCPKCPSAHFPEDPESAEIIGWVKSGQQRAEDWVFACAWRPQKLCRGICDKLGYTRGQEGQGEGEDDDK